MLVLQKKTLLVRCVELIRIVSRLHNSIDIFGVNYWALSDGVFGID